MIKLYQFTPHFGLPNASSFCMKLETYLRMVRLPYEAPINADMRKAPKGKFPYIEDKGKTLGDSGLIIAYLKATYGDPLDAALSPAERAVSLAFHRLLEENLYWVMVYSRWIEELGWELTRKVFFSQLPAPLKLIVPPLVRRGVKKDLRGHGMGRHNRDEIYAIGCADLTALADFLSDKPFFMGAQPTSLDAAAYATLANILWIPLDSPLKQHALKYPKFEAYCQHMKAKYYPETI